MRSCAPRWVVVPLGGVGGAMVLAAVAPPAGLVAVGIAGIGSVAVGVVLLVAAGVLWRRPPSPGQAGVLAGLSALATVLGSCSAGVVLGVLGVVAGLTSGRPG
ncbi:hypothetical protein [Streptomyces sp. NPDC053431]|uniref:hypothetical protein n=1 Tax=Streptomyces sp. NPDC053431 TaxID=3365703 RepID=UPI0037D7A684